MNETVAFTGVMVAIMGPLFPLYGIQVKWAHRAFRYPEWSDSLAIGGYFVIAGVAATAMVFEAFSVRDELSVGAALALLGGGAAILVLGRLAQERLSSWTRYRGQPIRPERGATALNVLAGAAWIMSGAAALV